MPRLAAALLLAAALPAQAQEAPICGGISLVGEWLGGTADGSDIATADAPFDGSGAVPIAGHLVRMFTLSAPAEIRVEVAARPEGDPYVTVFDAAGTQVGEDDDGGGDFAARAEMSLEPGSYCLAARSYESGVTEVDLRVGRADQAAMTAPAETTPAYQGEASGGCGAPDIAVLAERITAADLADGLSAGGPTGVTPAWALSLAEPLSLTLTGVSETGDPVLRLRDGTGRLLAENDDADGLNSRIDMTDPLPPGEYCLEVEDLNGSENDVFVEILSFDPDAERRREIAAGNMAPGPSDDTPIREIGILETVLVTEAQATTEAVWFSLNVAQGGLVLIEALGNGLDPAVSLFDRAGRDMGRNDDGPNGLDAQLVTKLFPGEYLLALRMVGDGQSGPVRIVMERYVPAQ
ncbi:hypothetical protein [uncultured Jannaschia sp.]|uniref:hypothetical protein n=1 Tax=uncultured Jannaschia sp. TaxID=293347 RepID=UPI00261D5A63|nr:hypothetical protein [uncultured Jannaschia sp.]